MSRSISSSALNARLITPRRTQSRTASGSPARSLRRNCASDNTASHVNTGGGNPPGIGERDLQFASTGGRLRKIQGACSDANGQVGASSNACLDGLRESLLRDFVQHLVALVGLSSDAFQRYPGLGVHLYGRGLAEQLFR